MANPNKTVGNWLRKNPRPVTSEKSPLVTPKLDAIMDAVSKGEMTPKEAAAALAQLQNR